VLTSDSVLYLDSSALVKLAADEAESIALAMFLGPRPRMLSCELAIVEVVRAVRRLGPVTVAKAERVLEATELIRLEAPMLAAAAQIDPLILRSVDAIHLAAARTVGTDLRFLVTYDHRLAGAARDMGIEVVSPGVAV
jgi:uncharacterized protein